MIHLRYILQTLIHLNIIILFRVNLEEHVFRNVKSESVEISYDTLNTFPWWIIPRQTCINVFAGLIFTMVLIVAIKSILFVSVCVSASMNLHNKMLVGITKATMFFFNTNSSGTKNKNMKIII